MSQYMSFKLQASILNSMSYNCIWVNTFCKFGFLSMTADDTAVDFTWLWQWNDLVAMKWLITSYIVLLLNLFQHKYMYMYAIKKLNTKQTTDIWILIFSFFDFSKDFISFISNLGILAWDKWVWFIMRNFIFLYVNNIGADQLVYCLGWSISLSFTQ